MTIVPLSYDQALRIRADYSFLIGKPISSEVWQDVLIKDMVVEKMQNENFYVIRLYGDREVQKLGEVHRDFMDYVRFEKIDFNLANYQ